MTGRYIRFLPTLSLTTMQPAGLPQWWMLAPTLFLLYINDYLFCTSNPIHNYADDSILPTASQSAKVFQPAYWITATKLGKSLSCKILILKWGESNFVKFNASQAQSCFLSRKVSHNHSPLHGLVLP